MSSLLSSEGVVLAAMAAVSGTIILLAFRLHKSPNHYSSVNAISSDSQQLLRSCISSEEGERKEEKIKIKIKKKKNKNKKVHFADNVVDPTGNSKEYRKLSRQKLYNNNNNNNNNNNSEDEEEDDCSVLLCSKSSSNNNVTKEMPANRAALYNGILRDRLLHRVAYSF